MLLPHLLPQHDLSSSLSLCRCYLPHVPVHTCWVCCPLAYAIWSEQRVQPLLSSIVCSYTKEHRNLWDHCERQGDLVEVLGGSSLCRGMLFQGACIPRSRRTVRGVFQSHHGMGSMSTVAHRTHDLVLYSCDGHFSLSLPKVRRE